MKEGLEDGWGGGVVHVGLDWGPWILLFPVP